MLAQRGGALSGAFKSPGPPRSSQGFSTIIAGELPQPALNHVRRAPGCAARDRARPSIGLFRERILI
jgi:hypothetical protein